MKVNTKGTRAKNAMLKHGKTENRPEEKLAYLLIRDHLIGIVQCEEQYTVKFDDIHYAKLDVYFTIALGQRYAVRLMGEYHDPKKQERHDRVQYHELLERGFIVIDFWYNQMPYLFKRREGQLHTDDILLAYGEIKKQLAHLGLFLQKPKLNILDYQEHIKSTV